MRFARAASIVALSLVASAAAAQTPADALTPLQQAVACAPPTSLSPPQNAPLVIGAQDTVDRTAYDERDLILLGAGSREGLRLNQQFYVRRAIHFGAYGKNALGSLTQGWIRVVAVNETTSIASVDHVCGAIFQGDYLEPFTVPAVPADADLDRAGGEPDFATTGHVMFGVDAHVAGGRGDLMLIDLGADHGYAPGARFAIYRDTGVAGVPLASVGEAAVVLLGPSISVIRITRSRDAVVTGDYVVPRK